MGNNSYFGIQMGQAVIGGLKHIYDAMQRKEDIKYREEERNKALALQEEQRLKSEQLAFAPYGEYIPQKPRATDYGPRGLNQPMMGYTEEQISPLILAHQKQMEMQQQMQQAKINDMGNGGGKSPAGYRPTKEGNLEMIPGGPADLKAQADMTKTKESQATQDSRIENTKSRVDKAIGRLGFFTTGFGADTMASIGGTEARGLKGDLDTIKANLAFDRLTAMRNESKTGGALGNVSDRELGLLTAAAASLDQGMKKSDLEANLKQIKEILDKAKSTPESIVLTPEQRTRLQELRAKRGK